MTTTSSEDEDGGALGMFDEPKDYTESAVKQPTFVKHITGDGRELNLRLVGSSALWVGRHSLLYLYKSASHLSLNLVMVFASKKIHQKRRNSGCRSSSPASPHPLYSREKGSVFFSRLTVV